MDISEQKKIVKEYKQLNRQARAIIKQMQQSADSQTIAELQRQWSELQQRLDEINEVAVRIIEENETPLTDIVTPTQAQRIWDEIRNKIRLAKFHDEGIQPPDIDMKKVFAGKKYLEVHALNAAIQKIIGKWSPTV